MEVCQCALFLLIVGGDSHFGSDGHLRIQPPILLLNKFLAALEMAWTRGSSFGSVPGAHGKGKVSKVDVGV